MIARILALAAGNSFGENARLFAELQERLEEQTATAGILRAISTSPTDARAVLQLIVETAGQLFTDLSGTRLYTLVEGGLRADAYWLATEVTEAWQQLDALGADPGTTSSPRR